MVTMGEMRQRHAVDAAAHGDGDLVERREHLRQGALQRNHGVRPTARRGAGNSRAARARASICTAGVSGNVVGFGLAGSPPPTISQLHPDGTALVLDDNGPACQHRSLLAPQPQTECRGLLENCADDRIAVRRISHYPHCLQPTPLFADAGEGRDVADARNAPETIEARRQLFGGLIVDVELYHKDRIACRFRRSETENAQHVGNTRELPAASAHAGRNQFSGRSVAGKLRIEIAQDGGAGRRHSLARRAIIGAECEAGEQMRGGRRRHRQKPVGRAHRASSERQRPAMPARPREKIDDGGRADDVGHGVPIRQFMKMYSLDRNTMYRCFCLGQQRQDAESVVAIRCRERRLGEPSANIGVSTARGGCASLEDKPRCGKATAAALHERDFAALREAAVPDRAQHRRGQCRPCVEHRGDEHVAAHAADGVEND